MNYQKLYYNHINIPVILGFIIPYLSCLTAIYILNLPITPEDKLLNWIFFFIGIITANYLATKLSIKRISTGVSTVFGILIAHAIIILVMIFTGVDIYI